LKKSVVCASTEELTVLARLETTRSWGRRLGTAAFLGLLMTPIVALMVAGCTEQRRYEVLSMLFDGVPDPNAPPAPSRLVRQTAAGTPLYMHEPYANGECSDCHKEQAVMVSRGSIPPGLCQECHADVATKMSFVHGPVSANACGECHAPHTSQFPRLLVAAPRDMCVRCHAVEELLPAPGHLDPQADCTSCHSGHGGADRRMLRVDYVHADPATTQPPAPVTPATPASPDPDDSVVTGGSS
jgi:predicted CXXCH cytochrome family protein